MGSATLDPPKTNVKRFPARKPAAPKADGTKTTPKNEAKPKVEKRLALFECERDPEKFELNIGGFDIVLDRKTVEKAIVARGKHVFVISKVRVDETRAKDVYKDGYIDHTLHKTGGVVVEHAILGKERGKEVLDEYHRGLSMAKDAKKNGAAK